MIFLSFMIPPAIYLLTLAIRNRSRHPFLLSGRWDFVGVVFALSGLILFGGPAMLNSLYQHWRLSWLLGRTRFLNSIAENWYFWCSLWVIYFAVMSGSIALLIWRRRNQTSIYNIEPANLAPILMQVLERLGLAWSRGQAGRIFIGDKAKFNAVNSRAGLSTTLDVESFPAMCHVTLHWVGDFECVRPAVEAELSIALRYLSGANGPAANWFLGGSLALFLLASLLLFRLIWSAVHTLW